MVEREIARGMVEQVLGSPATDATVPDSDAARVAGADGLPDLSADPKESAGKL